MKAFVFIGPSITAEEAINYCEAEFLPPVELGNVAHLLQYKPHVIGIIDGYFDSVPAVWHKEILLALSAGVYVVGGASMGALRAAELHTFGMEGAGEIFEWYRDGIIEADDEVAVVHTTIENNYQSFSEPLVNIRKTLAQALVDGVLDRDIHKTLIEIARQTFYRKRNYPQLLIDAQSAGIPAETISALELYIQDHKVDLKKLDAIRVLQRVEKIRHTSERFTPNFDLVQTEFLKDLVNNFQTVQIHQERSIDIQDMTNHARLEWKDFPEFRLKAFTNLVLLQYAARNGITLSPNEIDEGKEDFLNHLGIREEEIKGWAAANHIPSDQFEQYLLDWLLLRKTENLAHNVDNRTLLWQARLENKYRRLLSEVKEMQYAADLADEQMKRVNLTQEMLFDFFRKKLDLPPEADVMAAAQELGFNEMPTFLLSLLRSYLAHHNRKD